MISLKVSSFYQHYQNIYQERWPQLFIALSEPVQHIAWRHPERQEPYFLDGASEIAANALPVPEKGAVLDLCAAPGGKTLALSHHLARGCTLVANERSLARRMRLKKVLENHLPVSVANAIRVTGHDATQWCLHETSAYEAILLDAPCSSERHLIHQPALLKDWSPRRSRFLAQRQYAMLASALQVVKPGGHILYSTCSLSPEENDGVIEKLRKKKKDAVVILPLQLPYSEERAYGCITLPDTSSYGPLYAALIQRSF